MRYGGVLMRRIYSGFHRLAEDDGGNHNAECTTIDEASQSICKMCDMEVQDGQLAIICDMCSIWFYEECSGLSKKQINLIGEIDACKWLCGWCPDNVDDCLKCVSNNIVMKKDIEDIKRLVTSFNTTEPSYASKVSEKPPTNVNETCTGNRKYPDQQTLYISGTIDDDIFPSSVLQKRRLYTHVHGIKLDFTFTNKLGKIVLLSNNKDCCTRVKNKWCSNLLGTDIRVFSPNESRSHRGIIRDVPVEISTDDIKIVLAGEKEEEIQVIRYIKSGTAKVPLVELVFQRECTFNKYLQNGITL